VASDFAGKFVLGDGRHDFFKSDLRGAELPFISMNLRLHDQRSTFKVTTPSSYAFSTYYGLKSALLKPFDKLFEKKKDGNVRAIK